MSEKPLILIADDTTENLQVLGSMLKNKGYNIAAVTNGEEALDFVTKRKPALILLDVMMPRLNGYQACRKLKNNDDFKDIPVLFISALNELEDKLAGFEAGGVDFITKPFQKQEVLARVETHLALQEKKEKVAAYARQLEERNKELEKLQRELNEEWTKGKKLHQKFLPSQLPSTEQLDTCVYYQASKKLGGDFYNFIEIGDKIIAYVVDITGHGLDGALLNIFIRETINSFLEQQELDLKKLLKFIYHKYAKESFSDDYFICIALIVLDKSNMDLYYLNSGFQFNPLVVNEQGVEEIDARGLPISTAIDLDKYKFDYVKIELKTGDKFIIMTDGLVEENNNSERYGFGRVKEISEQNKLLSITSLLEELKEDFHIFKGTGSAQDDITILGLEHKLEV
ncbi:response regulator [Halanaerobacter jeridensis]|uniref:Stage 0 sporulation protein A homolog n=1 Tax=Halanaerobacter jeridensis TaxID=706427 RepID=A0A938XUG1_9FIRM|nr:response regulator [Halanaerobacter jeridensis]MBM7555782.1 CheY-like chemotaxis protein [Halanaerobacter jeridensis]